MFSFSSVSFLLSLELGRPKQWSTEHLLEMFIHRPKDPLLKASLLQQLHFLRVLQRHLNLTAFPEHLLRRGRKHPETQCALFSLGFVRSLPYNVVVSDSWLHWSPRAHRYFSPEFRQLVLLYLMVFNRVSPRRVPKDIKLILLDEIINA